MTTSPITVTPPATATNRAIQDIYPLSPTQQGLLFHSLYGNSQAGTYLVQVGYTLKGELNHDAFESAWQQLVTRHTILRTAFVWENLEAPVQVVGQKASLPIHWHHWGNLTGEEQQTKLSALVASDRTQGFTLSNAPLMRIHAIQLGANHYRILWTHHHIVLDGWSLPLLLKEWIASYQAACAPSATGRMTLDDTTLGDTTLGDTVRPYRDYIAWLQQQDLDAAKQFWEKQLAGISVPTPLGIDNRHDNNTTTSSDQSSGQSSSQSGGQSTVAEPSVSESSFTEQRYQLPIDLSRQLKAFAQKHRLTLSTLVQGAWSKVLSAYSGESTVLYGLARAGRPESLPDAGQRVGLFINTLPMRVSVEPESELIPWLQTIQAQQLAQQPYEYTPLVDIQSVSEIPRQFPLFESVIVFENYPLESAKGISGLDILDVSITEQTHYPLALFAVATDTLAFKALYDKQRFSAPAIARLFSHLHTTLATMMVAPQRNLGGVSILSSAEQQQLLVYGNGPDVSVSPYSVQGAITQQAKQNPDATAVIVKGETTSYQQLNIRANQLAHYLKQQGIASGTPIGLCVERSIDMVVSLLAILKAGCAYVPLDPTYPAARLQYAVADAGIEWIICHDVTMQVIDVEEKSLQQINLSQINLRQCVELIASQPTSETEFTPTPDSLAYLIYTSGSTGNPKGVPITHRSLSNLLGAMATHLQVKPTDTFMAVTTLAFDIAALELFLPLISGACLLLASNETARNSHQLIAYLDTYGVDIMQATPATWRLLLGSGWAGQNGLRILCGGEALDISLAHSLLNCGEEVWNVYGPTETTIWSSALALSKEMLTHGTVPIGHPIDNTQFHVLDEQQQPVPLGVAGELHIGGLGLSPGYWNREDLTREKFIDGLRLHSDQPITLYRTGDRVRYREDGTLEYLGRLDYQAKLRGYRIELGEIETAIARHKQIAQAVVVLQGEAPEHQQLAAYVTLTNSEHDTAIETEQRIVQDVRSQLTQHLPHYMVPTAYQVLPAFPLTPNGKVNRQALPTITTATTTPDTRPKTSIETVLADIWCAILPLDTVGIHDNFFEMGGHSLLVVNAQSKIRQKLGVELSMVDLFRYPTLSTLATHIDQLGQTKEQTDNQAKEKQEKRNVAVSVGKERLKKRLTQRKSAEQRGGQST
ncbi:MAG: amino acid adenylation domain-containing protein [Cyanobacteria bacterium P01_F01_bin.53]